ncbi:TPA: hypothetical protein JG871_003942 [Enterobacter hormaechei subsp. xiangfangensis]|nr:hypothetical protein [Enterobacter hormaechei subsp. xiangfangensis]
MRYQRLTAFLALRGLTFWEWLNLARNYDERHWALYNQFNEQEEQSVYDN